MQYQIIIQIFVISPGNIFSNATKKEKYVRKQGREVQDG